MDPSLRWDDGGGSCAALIRAHVMIAKLNHTRFHDTILAAAGNPVVRHAFAQTHCHLHTFRLYPADVDGAITVAEHSAVREAIRSCQPERAEEAMAEHIRNSFTRVAEAFEDKAALSPLEDSGPPGPHIVG